MTKKIEIDCLIALCHILNGYETFKKRLDKAMNYKYNFNFIKKLEEISLGKSSSKLSKAAKFYQENKDIINAINKYYSLHIFIGLLYSVSCNNLINYFYNYLLEHKKDLSKILEILNRLKKLGFENIFFEQYMIFENKSYTINPNMLLNASFTYLANIQAIPNYEGTLKYKSTSSNYKIFFKRVDNAFSHEITLNSLVFDAHTLPLTLSKKDTFDRIVTLTSKEEARNQKIHELVNLDLDLSLLDSTLNSLTATLDNSSNANFDNMRKHLLTLKDILAKLKKEHTLYEKEVLSTNPTITKELLAQELKLQQKKNH